MKYDHADPDTLMMRSENQRRILYILHFQSMSRAELADLTGLTRPCITFLVNDLIRRGLVKETVTRDTGIGRRPVMLEIVPEACVAAGVNISRNTISVGYVNLSGDTLAEQTLPNEGALAAEQLMKISEILLDQRRALGVRADRVIGLGVCAPGPLDYREGKILNPPNFDLWHQVPVANTLSALTGMPVYLENVSAANAIREMFYGAARGMRNFMVMLVNEGIGAGIVAGGALYRGANGLGCEIGHTSIQFDGRLCACGNRGCLEAYAAIPSLLRGTPYASWREAVDNAPASQEARALIEKEAAYLSTAIVNAVNLFDLQQIILMGDVAYAPELLLGALEKNVHERVIARGNTKAPTLMFDDRDAPTLDGAMACLYAFFVNTRQQ